MAIFRGHKPYRSALGCIAHIMSLQVSAMVCPASRRNAPCLLRMRLVR